MGLGIIQVPLFVAHARLARGELVEMLPDFRPAPLPVSAVYPHHRHLSPQVRIFVEWIAGHFEHSEHLWHDNRLAGPARRKPRAFGSSRQGHSRQKAMLPKNGCYSPRLSTGAPRVLRRLDQGQRQGPLIQN
jgi:LysR family transcriptional regulator for bpeEF and oprC